MTLAAETSIKRVMLNRHVFEFPLEVMTSKAEDLLGRYQRVLMSGAMWIVTNGAAPDRDRTMNVLLSKRTPFILMADETSALLEISLVVSQSEQIAASLVAGIAMLMFGLRQLRILAEQIVMTVETESVV